MLKETVNFHTTIYKYLVSSRKEGNVRTRMYQKDGIMVECQKEVVNLVKDPDAIETDVWECKFRDGEKEINATLKFDAMCNRFFSMALRAKLRKS